MFVVIMLRCGLGGTREDETFDVPTEVLGRRQRDCVVKLTSDGKRGWGRFEKCDMNLWKMR